MTWAWFKVRCSDCRWNGTRRANTATEACGVSCPRCGQPVTAAPTLPPGLGHIRFRVGD